MKGNYCGKTHELYINMWFDANVNKTHWGMWTNGISFKIIYQQNDNNVKKRIFCT